MKSIAGNIYWNAGSFGHVVELIQVYCHSRIAMLQRVGPRRIDKVVPRVAPHDSEARATAGCVPAMIFLQ